ncbi:hypothetical protein JTB14_027739 [Gonioctena quinquepunctata]|nr:hypothetical protein JTB14_027739 [Gonioctena quinquepunctata]
MRWERMEIIEHVVDVLNSGYVKCGDRERRECAKQAALIVKTLTQLDPDSNTSNVGGREPADCSSDSRVIRRREYLVEESRDPANCSLDFKGAGGHETEVFRKNSFLKSNMLPENTYNSQNFEVKRSHGFQRVCRAPPRGKDSITTPSRRIRLVPVRVSNSYNGSQAV